MNRIIPGTIRYILFSACVLSLVFCSYSIGWTNRAKDQFFIAEACYRKFNSRPELKKYRDKWQTCIKKFLEVYHIDPEGEWAAAGMFRAAELYEGLAKYSYLKSDLDEASDLYNRIIKRFPTSAYAKKARIAISKQNSPKPTTENSTTSGITDIKKSQKQTLPVTPGQEPSPPESVIEKIIQQDMVVAHGNNASTPVSLTSANNSRLATVTGLRFWSNPSYTRIVIDADKDTTFNDHLLKKDPELGKPQRLYVDLQNSHLSKNLKKLIPINDDLLINARAGQFTLDIVRVVVDIKSFDRYKIFSLSHPFRIVIDVWGKGAMKVESEKIIQVPLDTPKDMNANDLARQLALQVRRIVIDPGHGGKDFGAPGYMKGVHEKNVVLAIGQRLAQKIKSELGCEVVMTRNSDKYLTLEERTAIANTKNADLFISIHTNAHKDHRAFGVETYFLNLATDDDAILVAARENATSTRNISDLQAILNDLMQNAKINESSRLAAYVQNSIYKKMKANYSDIRDKGVKQAPFYVLLGAQMPAILIETAFISNPQECRRLNNSKYQDKLCDSIIEGVRTYIKETNPTAFIGHNNKPKG